MVHSLPATACAAAAASESPAGSCRTSKRGQLCTWRPTGSDCQKTTNQQRSCFLLCQQQLHCSQGEASVCCSVCWAHSSCSSARLTTDSGLVCVQGCCGLLLLTLATLQHLACTPAQASLPTEGCSSRRSNLISSSQSSSMCGAAAADMYSRGRLSSVYTKLQRTDAHLRRRPCQQRAAAAGEAAWPQTGPAASLSLELQHLICEAV